MVLCNKGDDGYRLVVDWQSARTSGYIYNLCIWCYREYIESRYKKIGRRIDCIMYRGDARQVATSSIV